MDFRFTAEEELFQQEVRNFLKQELPPDWMGPMSFDDFAASDEAWALFVHMARRLGEKGWLSLLVPQLSTPGSSPMAPLILTEEMAYHGAPGIDPFGVRMLAPALLSHGSEAQRERHLGHIIRGETFWCQGFSEPEAGSDLASLQTRAVEAGDYFLVSGQKVWTTNAHRAPWCFFLARTNPQQPKHRGLSFFLVDMKTPGITVRPVKNVLGEVDFHEVFFDEVKVPRENLVGEKDKGWYVTANLLEHERSAMVEFPAQARRLLHHLVDYVKSTPVTDGERVVLLRHKLAEMAIEVEVGRWLAYRITWRQSQKLPVTYENYMAKLYGSELIQRVASGGMEILGLYGQLKEGSSEARLRGKMARWSLSTIGQTVGGGTSEIQRTLIATRGLGLPRGD